MAGAPQRLNIAALVDRLVPGMTVFVSGLSGESLAFRDALRAAPDKARGVRFVGMFFPGINEGSYVGLHPDARQRAYFMSPDFRPDFRDGRVELLPVDYLGAWQDLSSLEIDLAVVQTGTPDTNGRLSPGMCHDFVAAVWGRARQRAVHINPRMPATASGVSLALSDCDFMVEAEGPVVTLPDDVPSAPLLPLAAHVASVVRDGDTVQFGVGKMATAVVQALDAHQRLRFHGGMMIPATVPLVDAGVIRGDGAITAGVALGEADFYARAASDPTFRFASVSETHDPRRIGDIDNFVAINAALEVDLFGQVNCDTLSGQLVAGVGGMPAFATGARLSRGGRTVFAMLASASRGALTRIVPRLSERSFAGALRHVTDIVVTEHGVADLRGATLDVRAQRLIGIAALDHRDALAAAWAALRPTL